MNQNSRANVRRITICRPGTTTTTTAENHIICAVVNSAGRVCTLLTVIPFLTAIIIYRCTGLCGCCNSATAPENHWMREGGWNMTAKDNSGHSFWVITSNSPFDTKRCARNVVAKEFRSLEWSRRQWWLLTFASTEWGKNVRWIGRDHSMSALRE